MVEEQSESLERKIATNYIPIYSLFSKDVVGYTFIKFSKSNVENKHFENSQSFDTRGTLKQNQLRLRLHSPYIVWIPQVPVLSVEHEDKNLISRGAIFTANTQDPLPSKMVRIIVNPTEESLCTLGVFILSIDQVNNTAISYKNILPFTELC